MEDHLKLREQSLYRDEFSWISDWAPGRDAVEGEEQYQQSLCVALNVDQDYRWDTRLVKIKKKHNNEKNNLFYKIELLLT